MTWDFKSTLHTSWGCGNLISLLLTAMDSPHFKSLLTKEIILKSKYLTKVLGSLESFLTQLAPIC